jgi:hypothetical protein
MNPRVRSQVRLFADDCLLYRMVKTQQGQQQLQTDLHSLERWATKWGNHSNCEAGIDIRKNADPIVQVSLSLYVRYIYNIRTLSVNIKFICTSFRNRQNSELFMPVSQRVQMNFIFTNNVRILCLSCNVKKVGKLVRLKSFF